MPEPRTSVVVKAYYDEEGKLSYYTETNKKASKWLREFCSCSCLTAMPGLACVLLSKIYIPFCSPL